MFIIYYCYLLIIYFLSLFGYQKVHLWRKYKNLYSTSPCAAFYLIGWDANLWIRNKFSNFTKFEKNRTMRKTEMPTAKAEKQVNSIVFNEASAVLLGLESSALAKYLEHDAVIVWQGVDQQTAWKGFFKPSQEHINQNWVEYLIMLNQGKIRLVTIWTLCISEMGIQ